jgi:hypothetical protein
VHPLAGGLGRGADPSLLSWISRAVIVLNAGDRLILYRCLSAAVNEIFSRRT